MIIPDCLTFFKFSSIFIVCIAVEASQLSKGFHKEMSSNIHVRSVFRSLDSISKFFFLSQSRSRKSESVSTWKSLTFWNVWTLTGCFCHVSFHLIYTSQNDIYSERPKLVTAFIDTYNKYCSLSLSATLVMTGYFQQANISSISEIFDEIETVFLQQLQIKIKNLNTLRWEIKHSKGIF